MEFRNKRFLSLSNFFVIQDFIHNDKQLFLVQCQFFFLNKYFGNLYRNIIQQIQQYFCFILQRSSDMKIDFPYWLLQRYSMLIVRLLSPQNFFFLHKIEFIVIVIFQIRYGYEVVGLSALGHSLHVPNPFYDLLDYFSAN